MPVRSGDESQTSIVNGGGKAGKRRQTSRGEVKHQSVPVMPLSSIDGLALKREIERIGQK
jgi:hypothetical protein